MANTMDYEALRADIHHEEEDGVIIIMDESDSDITVDDLEERREINYHLTAPTAEWVASRFLWAPSISGDTETFSKILSKKLLRLDTNMFICLNRIIVLNAEDDDEEFILSKLDISDLDMPNYYDSLGLKWTYTNSIIINMTAIEKTAKALVDEDEILDYGDECKWGFLVTLLHELRHLGLEANPYLPEDEYPPSLFTEEEVEQWARDESERLFGSI